LNALSLAYHDYHDTYKKGPADAKEFRGYAIKILDKDAQLALEGVERSDYIVFYGVNFSRLLDGTQNTVLAYHKDVPSKCGDVLMADGVIKPMSAADFTKSPKASSK